MKMNLSKNLRLCLLVFLLPTAVQAQESNTFPQGIEHVVVIGVDGLSPDGIRKANTPVLDKIIAGGAVKWNVRTVLPSSSSPNWASMIMGAGPEAHGVLDNDWEKLDASLPPLTAGDSGFFPTIFAVLRKARPKANLAAVYHWDGFARLVEPECLSFSKHEENELAAAKTFEHYLIEKRPEFAFLQLDHVDGAGHDQGHGTRAYLSAVERADSLIGNVINAMKSSGLMERSLVIITSDHGGIGYGHGGASPEEAEIAMIYYGMNIKAGYRVQQQVYTYDLASTIAFALKTVQPYAWTGRPVKSVFEGFNEPSNLWPGKTMILKPIIYPDRLLFAQAGGLYVDQNATVKIKTEAENSVTRFTIDGTEPDTASTVYTRPFMLQKSAVIKARSFDHAGNHSLRSTAYFRLVKSKAGHGLRVKFYNGNGWKRLPDFRVIKPASEWESYEFNLNREQILPLLMKNTSTFAMSLKGYIDVPADGEYTFYTQSDDGSQLFINDKIVVDNNDSHGVVERSGKVQLKKGRHAIEVKYFNEAGGFWLDVFYAGPGLVKQLVPADKLFLNQ
jgi:hypothetical protein